MGLTIANHNNYYFCNLVHVSDIMGHRKKIIYNNNEKKGLSQARNLGTDRVLGKVQQHANITGHKVRTLK